MKRIVPFLLAVCLLFTGCGDKNTETETTLAPTVEVTEAPTTAPETTAAPTTEATTAPTVPSETTVPPETGDPDPLTGLMMPKGFTGRPYAVVINNIIDAMPQHGIRDAEIIYEVLAEGGVTRCLAIFRDPSKTGPIGSIRSARPYFADIAMAYDAIFVHAGGSDDGYREISSTGVDHLDGVRGPGASNYFYRDQDRLSMGYNLEHTLFLHGDDMMTYAAKREFDLTREEPLDYGLQFAQVALPKGAEAKTVVVDFANSSKESSFVYQADTGLYAASQYGTEYIDAGSGEQMMFRNLIIITAGTHYDSDGYRLDIDLIDSGEGWFVCDGKMVPILWSREDLESPFVYTLEDGTPLTLGTGRTYIAVAPRGSEIICE